MPEYRFKIGDLVRVQIGILPKDGGALLDGTSKSLDGIYRVTHLLPRLVTDEPRYRIKGCYGQPERVVEEIFLTPVAPFAQPRA
jgi:hypothetical protein